MLFHNHRPFHDDAEKFMLVPLDAPALNFAKNERVVSAAKAGRMGSGLQ
jgi:hypothetical protein